MNSFAITSLVKFPFHFKEFPCSNYPRMTCSIFLAILWKIFEVFPHFIRYWEFLISWLEGRTIFVLQLLNWAADFKGFLHFLSLPAKKEAFIVDSLFCLCKLRYVFLTYCILHDAKVWRVGLRRYHWRPLPCSCPKDSGYSDSFCKPYRMEDRVNGKIPSEKRELISNINEEHAAYFCFLGTVRINWRKENVNEKNPARNAG